MTLRIHGVPNRRTLSAAGVVLPLLSRGLVWLGLLCLGLGAGTARA